MKKFTRCGAPTGVLWADCQAFWGWTERLFVVPHGHSKNLLYRPSILRDQAFALHLARDSFRVIHGGRFGVKALGREGMLKNVLVIEDDAAVRQTLRDVLEMQGYQVTTAADGKEGLALMEKMAGQQLLVLLDLMMPNMNGWQFLDVQRNDPRFKDVPVIVCSAYTESAKSIKPAAIIEKPVRLNSLLGTLKAFSA